jgi:hypothetical protein
MPEGSVLKRLSSTMLLLNDDVWTMRLLAYHMLQNPSRFKVYDVRELSLAEFEQKIVKPMASSRHRGTRRRD